VDAVPGLKSTAILKKNIDDAMQWLGSISGMVANVSNNLAEHAVEISSSSSTVASQMSDQAQKAKIVNSAVETLVAALSAAIATAENTVQVANKSEHEGEGGKLVLTRAMTAVGQLNECILSSGKKISKLGKDSEQIIGIINVIKNVAEQTNLLALNAAIEAARAGEQGRGFAVVADEVRTLAGKTQQYTGEIETIIDTLVASIKSTAIEVESAVELASESDEVIEEVVISYSEIVGHMVEVSNLGSELSAVTQHEKCNAENVFDMLESISNISQVTVETAEQVRSASNELSSLGEQLRTLSIKSQRQTTDESSDQDDANTQANVELF